jgi:hypothetical protein
MEAAVPRYVLPIAFTCHVAFAEATPPALTKPGATITVDVSTDAATVQLPGVEARLVAVVAPGSGVFTVQGPPFATNAITGVGAAVLNDYYAEGAKPGVFGVSMELRREAGYTDMVALDSIGAPKSGNRVIRGRGARVAGAELNSATTYFALLDLTLTASSRTGTFDLATTVIYGPPFDESLDIPLDGSGTQQSFMGMKITPTIIRLPETDPESELPSSKRPAVSLLFAPPKALPGFEVQAIRSNDSGVRAYQMPDMTQAPRAGKAQWDFGFPEPISKSSITKFVFRGYRLQPIVWKNIALPPGIVPAK